MMTAIQPDVVANARYSVNETASLLGIARRTVERWVELGRLRPTYDKYTMRQRFTGREILRCWNASAL